MQEAKLSNKRVVKPGMDLVSVKLALDDISSNLNFILDYVDKVIVITNCFFFMKLANHLRNLNLIFFHFLVWQIKYGFEYGQNIDENHRLSTGFGCSNIRYNND